MEMRTRVLSLYKCMLRESYKFSAYNHRLNHTCMNLLSVADFKVQIIVVRQRCPLSDIRGIFNKKFSYRLETGRQQCVSL